MTHTLLHSPSIPFFVGAAALGLVAAALGGCSGDDAVVAGQDAGPVVEAGAQDTGARQDGGTSFFVCPPNIQPTFTSIRVGVFDFCTGCHAPSSPDGGGAPAGLSLMATDGGPTPYAALVDAPAMNVVGSDKTSFPKRVAPGNPDTSFLIKKLTLTTNADPKYGSGMPYPSPGSVCPATLDAIRTWIRNGAPNN